MNDAWWWWALAVPVLWLLAGRPGWRSSGKAQDDARPSDHSAADDGRTDALRQATPPVGAKPAAAAEPPPATEPTAAEAARAALRQARVAAAERFEQQRRAAEAARVEAERQAAERQAAEMARADAERQAAQAARAAAEARRLAEQQAAEQQARAEAEQRAALRLQAEREATVRAEAQRETEARAAAERQAAIDTTAPSAHPHAERPAPEGVPPPSAARSASTPRTPEQTLVMVVDDSKVVRVKTSRLLARLQYRVALAEDGSDALRQIETELPQELITVVEMPGIDGFELTRRVRADPRTATLPIIMITSADDRLRDAAAAAGVTLMLGKPFADDELLAQVARHAGVVAPAFATAD